MTGLIVLLIVSIVFFFIDVFKLSRIEEKKKLKALEEVDKMTASQYQYTKIAMSFGIILGVLFSMIMLSLVGTADARGSYSSSSSRSYSSNRSYSSSSSSRSYSSSRPSSNSVSVKSYGGGGFSKSRSVTPTVRTSKMSAQRAKTEAKATKANELFSKNPKQFEQEKQAMQVRINNYHYSPAQINMYQEQYRQASGGMGFVGTALTTAGTYMFMDWLLNDKDDYEKAEAEAMSNSNAINNVDSGPGFFSRLWKFFISLFGF